VNRRESAGKNSPVFNLQFIFFALFALFCGQFLLGAGCRAGSWPLGDESSFLSVESAKSAVQFLCSHPLTLKKNCPRRGAAAKVRLKTLPPPLVPSLAPDEENWNPVWAIFYERQPAQGR
jgi:hypothetical protein